MTLLRQTTDTLPSGIPCSDWQSLLRDNVTDIAELCEILQLPISVASEEAAAIQPLNVTRDFLSRMEPGNPNDPLLLQILPREDELGSVPDFDTDPLDEASYIKRRPLAGSWHSQPNDAENELMGQDNIRHLTILQKYPGRTLILASDYCAAHCRFCFRRHFRKKKASFCPNYNAERKLVRYSTLSWNHHDEISDTREIILSGGDPLMLDDAELEGMFHYIKVRHTGNRVRLHTRIPVLLPERVTSQLVEIMRDYRLDPAGGAVFVALHVNHPNELSDKVVRAIALIIDAGIPVLSQTVLLRRVNDHFETLYDLFEKLANIRIIPYYLHQLDRVQGAAHFEVATAKGLVLLSKLSTTLPGYAVPRYVRETPGESKKTPV